MPSGRLAGVTPGANTNTLLWTNGGTALTVVTVSAVTRQRGETAEVRVALCTGGIGTLTDADWIEFDSQLGFGSPLERSGIPVAVGQSLVVRASTANVTFNAFGVE
jgi:hypothetical protein